MGNEVIVGVIALVVLLAVGVVCKRAKSKTSCCGSASDYKAKKKKLKNVIATKTFRVDGMHCEKCSNRVMEIVNDIPHAAGTVDLKKGILTVSYEEEVPDEEIKARIERVGYQVTPM